jgi:hypothetical protein
MSIPYALRTSFAQIMKSFIIGEPILRIKSAELFPRSADPFRGFDNLLELR